jgi:hypothetical protein
MHLSNHRELIFGKGSIMMARALKNLSTLYFHYLSITKNGNYNGNIDNNDNNDNNNNNNNNKININGLVLFENYEKVSNFVSTFERTHLSIWKNDYAEHKIKLHEMKMKLDKYKDVVEDDDEV